MGVAWRWVLGVISAVLLALGGAGCSTDDSCSDEYCERYCRSRGFPGGSCLSGIECSCFVVLPDAGEVGEGDDSTDL
ncbi:MAG: hypothetical protein HY905_02405 [Deltaproteobacteria bacterium]|nr:hypothetical protein [Deltaproteobacteria bacterium]